MIKSILTIFSILMLLSSLAKSSDWEVIDIPDKGIKQGDLDHQGFRSQAVSTCDQKRKFTFQFYASDFSSEDLFPNRMRYFCSSKMLNVDPIEGKTVVIKKFLWAKRRVADNPLHWHNYSETKTKSLGIKPKVNSNNSSMNLEAIKQTCLSFGYKEGTEKFADCSKDLFLKNN